MSPTRIVCVTFRTRQLKQSHASATSTAPKLWPFLVPQVSPKFLRDTPSKLVLDRRQRTEVEQESLISETYEIELHLHIGAHTSESTKNNKGTI